MTLVCPSPSSTPFNTYPSYPSHYSHSATSSQYSTSPSSNSIWSVASTSSGATSVSSTTLEYPPTQRTSHRPSCCPEKRRRVAITRNATAPQPEVRHAPPPPAPSEVLPAEQRQHPRRTSKSVAAGPCGEGQPPPVPTLQRQADRKVNFVENLVDSAAQIVETIWTPPKPTGCQPADKVLPLRTFIQETLRRSRTSYSTLQVALYYLIVIRPRLPAKDVDISTMNALEAQLTRAMQCGRRMFLAALILASKYLQDRNYSARAWSRISGLSTPEININEMAFLKAVDWKLHITDAVFQKWTDLVLKYTQAPTSPTSSAPMSDDAKRQQWCKLVETLSPDLHEVELTPASSAEGAAYEGLDGENTPLVAMVPAAPAVVSSPSPIRANSPAQPPPSRTSTPPVPAPAGLRKCNSAVARVASPLTVQPPRTLEPAVHDSASSTTFHHHHHHRHHHHHQSTYPPPTFRRAVTAFAGASCQPTPAAGLAAKRPCEPTPFPRASSSILGASLGGAMAGAAQQLARTSFLDSRESWAGRRSSIDINSAAPAAPGPGCARRSSLATTCTLNSSPAESPSSATMPHCRPPTFKRTCTDDLKRLVLSSSSGGSLPTPVGTPSPAPSSSASSFSSSSYSSDYPSTYASSIAPTPPCASPRSREAALSLHQLRATASPAASAASSACSTPVLPPCAGRKRSADYAGVPTLAQISCSSVTPKFRAVGLGGAASPGGCTERKRMRCAVGGDGMGVAGVEGWRAGVGQDVR